MSWLINLLIVLLVVNAVWRGWQRGLWFVLGEAISLVVSVVAAAVLYNRIGSWLSNQFDLIPALADIFSFGLILIILNLVLWHSFNQGVKLLPPRWLHANLNHVGGAGLNALKTLGIIALALITLLALPLRAQQKEQIENATLPNLLLRYSGDLQKGFNSVIGRSLEDTLNFFTIRNTSSESVALGFKTTSVQVNEPAEWRMLDLINQERTSRGLAPLSLNFTARPVARHHSRDMFARGYFAHVNPDGQDPFDRMQAGGVQYNFAGENLAYAPTVQAAHRGLMNSPGHRANILRPEFRTVGIGVIDGGAYGQMFTQNFTD